MSEQPTDSAASASESSDAATTTKSALVERGVVVQGVRLATAMNDAPRALYARAALIVMPEVGFVWQDYLPVLEHYAGERRVFALDWPGFGSSAKPAPAEFAYDEQHFAEIFAGWMDNLGIGRGVLLATGVSALPGIRYASAHPKRTLGLALVSPVGFTLGGISSPLIARILRTQALLKRLDGYITSLLIGPASTPEAGQALERHKLLRKAPDSAGSLLAYAALWRGALTSSATITALAQDVAAPVMVLRGALDPLVTAEEMQRTAAMLGGRGTLSVSFPEAGHLPFLQQPARFYQALSGVLETAEVVALQEPTS